MRPTNTEILAALQPFVVEMPWPGPGMLSASQTARRLHLTRKQVYSRIGNGEILAWKSGNGRFGVPEAQFFESGEVVRGISDVAEIIGNPELAWDFLTHEWPFAHSAEVPLEKLRRGEVEESVGAALSYGFAFT